MKKQEYMNQLETALSSFDADTRKEIMEDYEEHYQIGLQEGKTEDQISEELGEISELVKDLQHIENQHKDNEQEFKKESQAQAAVDQFTKVKEEQENPVVEATIDENEKSTADNNNSSYDPSNPSKIVIRSKFADVDVQCSGNNQIFLNAEKYGGMQDSYEFHSWREGNVIYGEIVRNDMLGLMAHFTSPKMKIFVRVPEHFPEIEIRSMSGDVDMSGLTMEAVNVVSASGDISVALIQCGQLRLDTKSGDVTGHRLDAAHINVDSASGDIELRDIKSGYVQARALSGDVKISDHTGNELYTHTASGDIRLHNLTVGKMNCDSMSGNLNIDHTQGNQLNASTKSGDLKAEICVEQCECSSISGTVEVYNAKDAVLQLSSVSGNIRLRLNNSTGYEADVRTVSGYCSMSYQNNPEQRSKSGLFTFGNGASRIQAKTTSGNITVRG